jgi:hypothetical protein
MFIFFSLNVSISLDFINYDVLDTFKKKHDNKKMRITFSFIISVVNVRKQKIFWNKQNASECIRKTCVILSGKAICRAIIQKRTKKTLVDVTTETICVNRKPKKGIFVLLKFIVHIPPPPSSQKGILYSRTDFRKCYFKLKKIAFLSITLLYEYNLFLL